jgi:hypothetical protein
MSKLLLYVVTGFEVGDGMSFRKYMGLHDCPKVYGMVRLSKSIGDGMNFRKYMGLYEFPRV